MEIMDPVHGMITVKEELEGIVTSELFNRMRNISQLGTIQYIFPGANHSRYSHSLGVYHLGSRLANKIKYHISSDKCFNLKNADESLWNVIENTFLAACLLHDIGHLPFSHSLHKQYENTNIEDMAIFKESKYLDYFSYKIYESIAKEKCNHELTGLLLSGTILHKKMEIDPSLFAFFLNIATVRESINLDIKQLADKYFANGSEGFSIFEIFAQYISGCFDLDKMDYLVRDSNFTGVPISLDIDLIFKSFELRKFNGDTIVSYPRRMRLVLDQFIYARLLMYNQVYFHPKNIVLERIISDIIPQNYTFFDVAKKIAEFNKDDFKAFTDSTILNLLFKREEYKKAFLNHHKLLKDINPRDSEKSDNSSSEREVRKLRSVKSSDHKVYVANKKWDFDRRLLEENANIYRIVDYKFAS